MKGARPQIGSALCEPIHTKFKDRELECEIVVTRGWWGQLEMDRGTYSTADVLDVLIGSICKNFKLYTHLFFVFLSEFSKKKF